MMSNRLPLATDELLRRLLDAEVDFIIVGAFAVAAHGAPRATTDLDIFSAYWARRGSGR